MLSIISAITFDVSRIDANAITIFLIGFGIVFAALISIYLFFNFLPKLLNMKIKKKEKGDKVSKTETVNETSDATGNQDVYAAIAMALHLHMGDMHDDESMVLTIDPQLTANSQWNSKIQNINN